MRRRLNGIQNTNTIVDVHTLHSFGLQLLGTPSVDPDKVYKLWYQCTDAPQKVVDQAKQEWQALHQIIDSIQHCGWIPSTPEPRIFISAVP